MVRQTLIYISVYVGLFVASFYFLSMLNSKKKEPKLPKKLPRVSIIVPAYNEEKGIQGTIRHALDLDYPKNKIEVIVVDDGSEDKTYEKAREIEKEGDKRLDVYRLNSNNGKGAAMNYGLEKSEGEIVITMDADNTLPEEDALKKVVASFNRPEVMCVAPAMAIHKPRGILQRVQQIEYLFGVFLRKAFSNVNAIHITPGAFSAYRRKFFKKYGNFEEDNLTEDMEMAMRVQYNGYVIENRPEAVVYTIAPNNFKELLAQRKRWYGGMVDNLWKYKRLFSKDYGVMGILVLPIAIFSIIMSMVLTSWIILTTLVNLQHEIALWNTVNFNILGSIDFSWYVLETYLFSIVTSPIAIFFALTVLILISYLFYAKSKVKKHSNIKLSIFFFLAFFALLFAFWWMVTLFYKFFDKTITWR